MNHCLSESILLQIHYHILLHPRNSHPHNHHSSNDIPVITLSLWPTIQIISPCLPSNNFPYNNNFPVNVKIIVAKNS